MPKHAISLGLCLYGQAAPAASEAGQACGRWQHAAHTILPLASWHRAQSAPPRRGSSVSVLQHQRARENDMR